MELFYLLTGLAVGAVAGYLAAQRKAAVARAEAQAAQQRQQLVERTAAEHQLQQQREWEQRLEQQRREAEEMHRRMVAEFENLSNRIFQAKAEDFSRLNAERLDTLLRPLTDNLKDFRARVEQVCNDGAKERFSLAERIKELVELNKRLGEDADNLARALKGDAKVQGDWGEMLLERLLQASGLVEGEHYVRQEFLRDERGAVLTGEESGQRMQPDVVVRFPDDKEMIIDSKVSLTAYAAYAAAVDRTARDAALKAHLRSVRAHVDELSRKDYSRYDSKAPDFVMMFVPVEGAYLLAIQNDERLWEYAYNKKVVLMSPTNLISALRLSLDLWRREDQVKNVEAIVRRGTALYEKVASFADTFLSVGDKLAAARQSYDKALGQLTEGNGSVIRQTELLGKMGLNPKKRISPRLQAHGDDDSAEASVS